MAVNRQYFHFSLGPVQDFITQARRTRDFWAGSFLLSWLAGVAMRATEGQGGTIVFPKPPGTGHGEEGPGYLDWIADSHDKPNPVTSAQRLGRYPDRLAGPVQGAIPNCFKALVPASFTRSHAENVEQAVREAWTALAEHVWKKDVAPRLSSEQATLARTVWDRQHGDFWEIAWILEPAPGMAASPEAAKSGSPVNYRKNWRSQLPPPEPGMKCHLMEGWQELSGIPGITAEENEKRRAFWKTLARKRETDFREAERLCAIAYVKRRFTRYFESFHKDLTLDGNGPVRPCTTRATSGKAMSSAWKGRRNLPEGLWGGSFPRRTWNDFARRSMGWFRETPSFNIIYIMRNSYRAVAVAAGQHSFTEQ